MQRYPQTEPTNSTAENPKSQALRDFLVGAALFIATAAIVLWQNAHLTVLWDLSYILDSAYRISIGQVPYRDLPFAHAPLTFLIQAAIIHLTGRVYFHHVLYAAIAGGLGSVLAWRIILRTFSAISTQAWLRSMLLAAPLIVLGIYSILPNPSYDCDCILSILLAIFLLQRVEPKTMDNAPMLRPILTGAALVLPPFFKQNIGLPFLLITLAAIITLLLANIIYPTRTHTSTKTWLYVLTGAGTTLLAAAVLIYFTVGLHHYIYWTVQFAAQRRLPGLSDMLSIYNEPSLRWTIPCIAIAMLLLRTRLVRNLWARSLALALLSAPFLWTIASLFLSTDSDDRASSLLALWPLLLILAIAHTLYELRRGPTLRTLLPVILLATIHGTMLSQQLWGSTYAIWPLLLILIAGMVASIANINIPGTQSLATALTTIIAATLLLCGGLYMASEERLSYTKLFDGPLVHATLPPLKGMAVRGPYLPAFEQLVRFAADEIPPNDAILLIPGEDPFYFTTGRIPQFPILLFDKATDPYSPQQIASLVRTRNVRWLIVKRNLQINEDATPQREATLEFLRAEFILYRQLDGYDIYRSR